jgi:hypothetical protein
MEEHKKLLGGLARRGLPVFSLIGHRFVRIGALAGLNKADWADRFVQRTALSARKILGGKKAGTLPVAISRQAQLMINMKTARTIGIYPGFKVLTDAILINAEPDQTTRELTLLGVMDEAMLVNLDLRAWQMRCAMNCCVLMKWPRLKSTVPSWSEFLWNTTTPAWRNSVFPPCS